MLKINVALLLLPYIFILLAGTFQLVTMTVKAIASSLRLTFLVTGVVVPYYAIEVAQAVVDSFAAGDTATAIGDIIAFAVMLEGAVTVLKTREKMAS
ncbi:hypothetical protein FSY45_20555 [Comamonas sp. Z1]|jgi:hypothetical protein|uniref:Uncharacterized protein n=2 Tax=Comamonas TaxID=283 RepID=A0A096FKL4_COMTE|nr:MULTISPECIES: hypothetical protein [Comamonas]KGH12715.1 hypothetical protein P608_10215 [Comamonas thiooxydans]KGH13807.1 hypothetical protein P607_24025 [Comamonas thiooxydans]KGH30901.1 hypothetical protein P353_08545 [Comamonas testosteroni]KKI12200.1 hypothetical protein XA67_20955 [Comamonas thiooxydans]TYK74227.1 hypothetical protein FSY45_20555 [Comamonas sp. Z1]